MWRFLGQGVLVRSILASGFLRCNNAVTLAGWSFALMAA
jgi:hypothetical protein